MSVKLAVILGAGASFDSALRGRFGVDESWKPPLATELFEPSASNVSSGTVHSQRRSNFGNILQKYPRARSLAGVLARETGRGASFEEVLRGLRDDEPHVALQFQQVPLYLQELLKVVSDEFVQSTSTDNLDALVSRLLRKSIDQVAFITLNYDLLLEQSLDAAGDSITQQRIDAGMRWYTGGSPKWKLLKLHGSVDWGRKLGLNRGRVTVTEFQEMPREVLQAVDHHLLRDSELGAIEHLGDACDLWNLDGDIFYPALAVPVDDYYSPVCPNDHLAEMEAFLRDCQNFLVIGARGKDADLCDLLGRCVQKCMKLGIVSASEAGAEETYGNLRGPLRAIPATSTTVSSFPSGFSEFINGVGWTSLFQN